MARKLNWSEESDDDGNTVWVAAGPYEEGFEWRLCQRLRDDKIEWFEMHDAELMGRNPESFATIEEAKKATEEAHATILAEEAELEMAAEGAMMCLGARDHVEALSDRELVAAVEKQIWAKLCRFGSQEDWLLDELINRFESQRGIERDDDGNILPPKTPAVVTSKVERHAEPEVQAADNWRGEAARLEALLTEARASARALITHTSFTGGAGKEAHNAAVAYLQSL